MSPGLINVTPHFCDALDAFVITLRVASRTAL